MSTIRMLRTKDKTVYQIYGLRFQSRLRL